VADQLTDYAEHGPECVLHCVDHEPDAECDCGLEQAIDAYESQAARIAELTDLLTDAVCPANAGPFDHNEAACEWCFERRRALASPREP
jgi:hypothetical protein